jgi:hypothetical protein
MILLWGLDSDAPLRLVREALDRRDAQPFFLDQRKLLSTEAELRVAEHVTGKVVVDGEALDLAEITAAYVRPHDWTASPELADRAPGDPDWDHGLRLHELLGTWTDVAPARILNRPSANSSNGSKPYQLQLIERVGLSTPETLVTSDPDEVLKFRERHGELIYKSVSGVRSIVARLTDERLTDLDDIAWCPTQFQRYLPGRDVRVHVVGERTLACEILTTAVDYRYAGADQRPVIRACSLPPAVADRCVKLAQLLGLELAGVDLRESDGEWFCFEINPSPAFSYYEGKSGLPIADAVAELLLEDHPV